MEITTPKNNHRVELTKRRGNFNANFVYFVNAVFCFYLLNTSVMYVASLSRQETINNFLDRLKLPV